MFEVDREVEPCNVCFQAIVTAVHEGGVVLDRTEFQAASPERESDAGHVDGIDIFSVVESRDGLLHRVNDLDATQGLAMGQVITAGVDMDRRRRLMCLHSLAHLVYFGYQAQHGKVNRRLGYVTANHALLELDQCRSDFVLDRSEIRMWIERVIAEDLVVTSLARPSDKRRRYWHVDGVGTFASVGSHPATTGEIGAFELDVEEITDDMVRLTARLLPE